MYGVPVSERLSLLQKSVLQHCKYQYSHEITNFSNSDIEQIQSNFVLSK